MAIFGFRLHRVTVNHKHTRKPLALAAVAKEVADPLDVLEQQARRLIGQVQIGVGTYEEHPDIVSKRWREDEQRQTKPLLLVEDVARRGRRLTVTMAYGTSGAFDHLLTFDGQRVSLKDKAPGRFFSVIIIVPTEGKHAFMISESRGRTYTGEAFLKWISVHSKWSVGDKDPWLRWQARAMSDGQRLNDLRNRGRDFKLHARRYRADGTPDSSTINVHESGLAASRIDAVLQTIAGWMDWKAEGNKSKEESKRIAGQDVGSLLAPELKLPDDFFDDGEIKFVEQGKTQTIRPSTVEELFVYPIGESRPSPEELFQHARPVLRRIANHEDDAIDLAS